MLRSPAIDASMAHMKRPRGHLPWYAVLSLAFLLYFYGSNWVRGPLREWAESLVDGRRLYNESLFEPNVVTRMGRQHISVWRGHQQLRWTILVCQAWNAARTTGSFRLSA